MTAIDPRNVTDLTETEVSALIANAIAGSGRQGVSDFQLARIKTWALAARRNWVLLEMVLANDINIGIAGDGEIYFKLYGSDEVLS